MCIFTLEQLTSNSIIRFFSAVNIQLPKISKFLLPSQVVLQNSHVLWTLKLQIKVLNTSSRNLDGTTIWKFRSPLNFSPCGIHFFTMWHPFLHQQLVLQHVSICSTPSLITLKNSVKHLAQRGIISLSDTRSQRETDKRESGVIRENPTLLSSLHPALMYTLVLSPRGT